MTMQTMRAMFCAIFPAVFSASVHAAEFNASVRISGAKYEMTVEWTTDGDLSLAAVARAVSDPTLLPRLSSKVESIQISPTKPNEYSSVMTLNTWGYRQRLPSDCEQRFENGEAWHRICRLRTSDPEGGRFMNEKTETIACRPGREAIHCELQINGSFKPLEIWGFELLSAKQLAVRAKAEALANQAQIWFFLVNGAVSAELSSRAFASSDLKTQIDAFLSDGTSALAASETFAGTLHTKTP